MTELTGVMGTLLLPLMGRYTESKKVSGLIHDDKCVELVERHNLDLSAIEKAQHPLTRLAWVARAWNTDAALSGLLSSGEATVLCLGCGLDTAYFRAGEKAVRWYDMDLPPVMEWRRHLIGEYGRCAMIAGDVRDAAVYAGIEVTGPLVVLAMGVLCYLTADEVKQVLALAGGLAADVTLVCDYFSEKGIEVGNSMVVKGRGAPMIWHADSARDIAAMRPGAQVLDDYPLFARILPSLTAADAAMAAQSDAVRIQSMAVVRL
jgi:O-methyltransferase involved in polyketide biosynthesis